MPRPPSAATASSQLANGLSVDGEGGAAVAGWPSLVMLLRDAQLSLGSGGEERLLGRWLSLAQPAHALALQGAFAETSLLHLGPPSELELELLAKAQPISAFAFGAALSRLAANLTAALRPLEVPVPAERGAASAGSGAALAGWIETVVDTLNKQRV